MPPLISFRAGRAFRRDTTKWVDPKEGRGLIYLEEEDGLLHFYYKDLTTNSTAEEQGGLDLLVFPTDATFSLLPSTRIAVLKFRSSSHRHFFWPQDIDPSADLERVQRINELIGGTIDPEEGAGEEQEMEIEREAPTVSTSAAVTSPLGSTDQMAQLSAIIANLNRGGSGSHSVPSPSSQMPEYILPDVLPPTVLQSLLQDNPTLVPILLPFLPPEIPQTEESLRAALNGPEFRRSLTSLDRALRTGALGPLVAGLGLPPSAAMGVEGFLEAIEKQAEEKRDPE